MTERGQTKMEKASGWEEGDLHQQPAVFEAGSWRDNRGSFLPQTQ